MYKYICMYICILHTYIYIHIYVIYIYVYTYKCIHIKFICICMYINTRVAVCCLQPLHHVPCAVAADTRPPTSRCLPPHAPTSATAACPFSAAM